MAEMRPLLERKRAPAASPWMWNPNSSEEVLLHCSRSPEIRQLASWVVMAKEKPTQAVPLVPGAKMATE